MFPFCKERGVFNDAFFMVNLSLLAPSQGLSNIRTVKKSAFLHKIAKMCMSLFNI